MKLTLTIEGVTGEVEANTPEAARQLFDEASNELFRTALGLLKGVIERSQSNGEVSWLFRLATKEKPESQQDEQLQRLMVRRIAILRLLDALREGSPKGSKVNRSSVFLSVSEIDGAKDVKFEYRGDYGRFHESGHFRASTIEDADLLLKSNTRLFLERAIPTILRRIKTDLSREKYEKEIETHIISLGFMNNPNLQRAAVRREAARLLLHHFER